MLLCGPGGVVMNYHSGKEADLRTFLEVVKLSGQNSLLKSLQTRNGVWFSMHYLDILRLGGEYLDPS